MINLNGNTVVKTCQKVRKAIDRRNSFTVFRARTRKDSLLLGTDGVLLTDDRKEAEGKQVPLSLPSITTRKLQPLTC